MSESLAHYGTPRHSGRYPWGSGGDNQQRTMDFLGAVDKLRGEGLNEKQIAEAMGMTTTELRAKKSIARNEQRKADAIRVLRMKEHGMSNVEIGKTMGINESSVRALLNPSLAAKADNIAVVADQLKTEMAKKGYLDVGVGTENHLNISDTKLKAALTKLQQEEGYVVTKVQVEQLTGNNKTTIKVLAPPGTTYVDVVKNPEKIGTVAAFSDDGGRSFRTIEPPTQISSKRIAVRYGDEGGADADGVMYVRPGVDDISLGGARYLQVRVAVDGTHYLKGMAVYKDDLPDGVDIMFNTNKKNTGNKLDAMKAVKDDTDNPFGSTVRQYTYKDKNGKEKLSAMNIVNDEGSWDDWSRTLASQMLSKQSPQLIKQQLDLKYEQKQREYDEIMALTNPTVKKKLLQSLADDADSSAVHLKAAAMPGQKTHAILPFTSIKENEVFAPNYKDGDRVVLVRYPHGGIFEIPELTVNNKNAEARKVLGTNPSAAVGINPKVAQRLSGADFDGDTVVVIPNNQGRIKNAPALAGLKSFDPQAAYPKYDGMKRMNERGTQLEMGMISNLITDMTIKNAPLSEIERAVRHSMVVIDAEKHALNYRQSEKDNGIAALRKKYQPTGGASTLISRSTSKVRVPERRIRKASEGGAIDPKTGKLVYVETGRSYTNRKGETIMYPIKEERMRLTDDARTLSSGTVREELYASHANRMKALGNTARKSMIETKPQSYNPSAKKVYDAEVRALNAKLDLALRAKPLERQAQLIANTRVKLKLQENPNLSKSEIKRLKSQTLAAARATTKGTASSEARLSRISITDREWEAIQAGAITDHKLGRILDHTDVERVKELATPRVNTVMTSSVTARAKTMLASGYTQAEIASALGIPASTINSALKG